MSCFNVSNTPKQISTPRARYQGVTAGNWSMPRKSGVTNIFVQNNYNGNYRNWAYDAWANVGQDQSSGHGFWHKFGNILGDISMGVSVGSGIVGTVMDWFGLGKK